MGEEFSPGGSEILRHEAPKHDFEGAAGDSTLIDAIHDHLDHFFEEDGYVFHERVSDRIHLDVHVVPPGRDRDWNTLVTSGMAELPMTVPDGLTDYRYAELVLALPSAWPLTQDAFADERHYWPVRLLKDLARLPHDYDTFLYYGHTVPNGDPPEPYAGTGFSCAFVGDPRLTPEGFDEVSLPDERTVRFMAVFPLHGDEMEYKLEQGADALWERFVEKDVTEWVDLDRPSVVGG